MLPTEDRRAAPAADDRERTPTPQTRRRRNREEESRPAHGRVASLRRRSVRRVVRDRSASLAATQLLTSHLSSRLTRSIGKIFDLIFALPSAARRSRAAPSFGTRSRSSSARSDVVDGIRDDGDVPGQPLLEVRPCRIARVDERPRLRQVLARTAVWMKRRRPSLRRASASRSPGTASGRLTGLFGSGVAVGCRCSSSGNRRTRSARRRRRRRRATAAPFANRVSESGRGARRPCLRSLPRQSRRRSDRSLAHLLRSVTPAV